MEQAGYIRTMGVSVLLAGWVLGTGAAAEEKAPAAPSAKRPAAAATQPPASVKSPQDKLREEILAKLTGTSWELELHPFETGEGKKPKVLKDTVTFKDRTVTSERLAKLGYGNSNFSLNVKEDGTATWETMQSKPGEGAAFWRGELEGERMRGVMSQQPTSGQAENFSFVGTQIANHAPPAPAPAVQPIAPTVQPAQPAVTPAVTSQQHAAPAPAPAVPPAEDSKAEKKKQGWF